MKAGDVLQTSQKGQITPIRAKYSPRIVKRMAVSGNVFQLTSTFTNSGPFYIGRLRPAQSNFPIVPLHYVRNTSRRAVTGLPRLSHVRSLRRPLDGVFLHSRMLVTLEDARQSWAMLVKRLANGKVLGQPCRVAETKRFLLGLLQRDQKPSNPGFQCELGCVAAQVRLTPSASICAFVSKAVQC